MTNSTIFAVSSGPAPSGVCVIRVSGAGAAHSVVRLTGRSLPPPRRMVHRLLHAPGQEQEKEPLDEALVVWFPGPGSFTGEDCVEFHVHGGRAVIAAVLAALSSLPGYVMAEPGAFSRRAFDNGKLDLSEAEGLADLIAAETDAQRKQALRQLEGGLGAICTNWQKRLTSARAHMEAEIDFSEEDLPETLSAGARSAISAVCSEISRHLDDGGRGEMLRDGIYIAILGPPNAGKSSLLNYLASREAAIVSEHAGTTRDVIEVHLDLRGFPVIVADTAGLRESDDAVEQEGVRRALARAERSDIRLVVLDGATWPNVDPVSGGLIKNGALGVVNKIDLLESLSGPAGLSLGDRPLRGISVKTGAGFDVFLNDLAAEVSARVSGGESSVVTRARHRQALEECLSFLDRCMATSGSELWAEDLRLGTRALGRIVGQVGVEDVLDIIFSEFCIGK